MKEYKRLTNGLFPMEIEDEPTDIEVYRRLKELEDKIENGTLVELPCTVGDKVYRWCQESYDEWVIVSISIYIRDGGINDLNLCVKSKLCGTEYLCLAEFIDKQWFFTKAEAEERLKELKGEV